MKKFARLTAAAIAVCVVTPVAAADVTVESIKKTFDAISADPAKVTAYCAMTKKMDEVGDDEQKAEAAAEEVDGYLKTLGAEFEAVWTAAENMSEDAPESKAFEEGLSSIDEKCGK